MGIAWVRRCQAEDHGDRCEAFAADLRDDGFTARAPELDETVRIQD
jgi:hypothetical protein